MSHQTKLSRDCLGVVPLSESAVQEIDDCILPVGKTLLHHLCLSHERLRHELAGALIVISDMQKELDDRAAKISLLEESIEQLYIEIMDLRDELNR